MKPAAACCVLLFAAVSSARAAVATPAAASKPVRMNFIGEGASYKDPDPATSQYMQGQLGGAVLPPPAPRPTPDPLPATPAAPASDAGRTRIAKPVAVKPLPAAAAPSPALAGRPSLWNGIVQPLDMPSAQAGTADPAAAREGAGRDYDSHILGLKDGAPRPELIASAAPSSADGAAAASGGGSVFVSLELDPREAGTLRDAVAGLGASAGFAADARFEALAMPGGLTMVSGWLPAGRLAEALARPGVKRLRVETRARPSVPSETSGEFLVGLRLDDALKPRDGASAGIRALQSAAGFRLTRVIGVETAPDGRAVAVVAGTVPLARLSRAMGLAEVVKISPLIGSVPSPVLIASPAPRAATLRGFARFAVSRASWLILATLLLALPSLRAPARRLASVFNPYR